jgi:hypothetical protein
MARRRGQLTCDISPVLVHAAGAEGHDIGNIEALVGADAVGLGGLLGGILGIVVTAELAGVAVEVARVAQKDDGSTDGSAGSRNVFGLDLLGEGDGQDGHDGGEEDGRAHCVCGELVRCYVNIRWADDESITTYHSKTGTGSYIPIKPNGHSNRASQMTKLPQYL